MPDEMTPEPLAALEGWANNPAVDDRERLSAALQMVGHLRALTATCTCPGHPNYDGPQADCAVHGAIRALGEAMREKERLRGQLADARAQALREVDEVLRAHVSPWGDVSLDTVTRVLSTLTPTEET